MVSPTIVILGLAPILLFTLWFLSATLTSPSVPESLRNKRIILLIAHPDDESMFFAPALQALMDPSKGNHLKILCLSTGDADGLGEVRRGELADAATTLGLRRKEDIFVMNDPRFRDGMKEKWEPKEIARVLAQAFAPQLVTSPPGQAEVVATPAPSVSAKEEKKDKDKKSKVSSRSSRYTAPKSSSNSTSSSRAATPSPAPPASIAPSPAVPEGPRATIDVLLTFDGHGVSSHPNHIALYNASVLFLRQIMRGHTGYSCPVDLYTLTTVNILRKYAFVFDVLPTYAANILDQAWSSMSGKLKSSTRGKNPKEDRAVFISDISRYLKARSAMVQGHKSQMVWFRWGWISAGRYMVINDLKREVIAGT